MRNPRIQDTQGRYHEVTAEELTCKVLFNPRIFTPDQLRTISLVVQRELEKRIGHLSAVKGG